MSPAIHSLWIGTDFSLLEILTMKSFIDHGYNFNLWAYSSELKNKVPGGVVVRDANEILPESRIFFYKNKGDCRRGAVGGFSDLFRYYLIYKQGGTYVDMDVTCLEFFNFKDDYYFRPHKGCKVVGNIFKAPKDSPFLKECIEETEKQINEDNSEWVLPVKIFSEMVFKHKLDHFIMPVEYYGNDDSEHIYALKTKRYYTYKKELPKYGLHWCREASFGRWENRQRYNWQRPEPLSIYYCLLAKHELLPIINHV
jgi:hypothetical protein